MNDFVIIGKNKEPMVKTFDLYSGFGYATHRMLKKVIDDNKDSFLSMGFVQLELHKPKKGSKGGRPEESYLLNERQFTLLVMLVKNSPSSVELKVRVANEFFRMREELKKIAPPPSPYIERVREILLLDAPSDWVKLYPNEYYQALMQLYGKQFTSNNHTPPFCGQITKRWIYDIVLPPELNNEIDAQRKEEQKHRWFKDKGREVLLKQIMDVTGIARQSRDRKEFEARCGAMFKNEPFQLMMLL